MTKSLNILDEPKPLRLSKLWDIQSEYYLENGVELFGEVIPNYISSNTFIAHHYSQLVLMYLKDLNLKPNQKLYIVETGAASGQFSFYFLKQFVKELNQLDLNVQLTYIISDCVERNVEYCKSNPSIQPFIDQGLVDFAVFDIESENLDIQLMNANISLSSVDFTIPLIVISNYTFDSTRCDHLIKEEGELYEYRYGVRSRYEHFDNKGLDSMREIILNHSKAKVALKGYYENSTLQNLLEYYCEHLDDGLPIIIPVAAVSFLEEISRITNNQAMFITGDKGIVRINDFQALSSFNLYTYDGGFSFLVNYDALGRICQDSFKGDALLCESSSDFKVSLFSLGHKIAESPLLSHYFYEELERTTPDDLCYLYLEAIKNDYRYSIKAILAMLRFSHYDPSVYMALHDRIVELVPISYTLVIKDLRTAILKVKENIYHHKPFHEIFNLLGMYFHSLKEDDLAIEMYNEALIRNPKLTAPHNNLGVLYEEQGDKEKALIHFKEASKSRSGNEYAKSKVEALGDRPYIPFLRSLFKIGLVTGILFFGLWYIK